jgi:hypothetical protein
MTVSPWARFNPGALALHAGQKPIQKPGGGQGFHTVALDEAETEVFSPMGRGGVVVEVEARDANSGGAWGGAVQPPWPCDCIWIPAHFPLDVHGV